MIGNKISDILPTKLKDLQVQYFVLPAIYFLGYMTIKNENPWIFIWVLYFIIPLADMYLVKDWKNPTKEESQLLAKDIRYSIPLYVSVLAEWVIFFWVMNFLLVNELSLFTKLGIIIVIGTLGASTFVVAHELNHRRKYFDKILGCSLLAKCLYLHWYTEHNYGHHKYVATPGDPAFSRVNESLYQYLPKVVINGLKSAWKIEAKKITKIKGYSSSLVPQNKMVWFLLNDLFLFPFIIYYIYDFSGLFNYILITAMSIIYLESVNYIEHYGIERKKISKDEWEKVNITHSWNAPHKISNYLLFKLQRHSDHHENAYKPYQTLCSYEESPQLPQGYTLMVLISFFAPIWFNIMNPRILAYQKYKTIPKEVEISCQNEIKKLVFNLNIVLIFCMLIGFVY